ncbi:MAG: hypothetical protein RIB60_07210 [Phycisphaerales bacterium]
MPPERAPRPLYVSMIRGLWKPFLIFYLIWTPTLALLIYARLCHGLPTGMYVFVLIALILGAIIPGAVVMPLWVARLQRRVQRAGGRICPNCLYDLRALDDADRCPECGWDLTAEPPEETWAKLINRGAPLPPPTDPEPRTPNEPRPGGSGPDSPGHA